MTKEELFVNIKQLISKLDAYKLRGTITFDSSDEVAMLKRTYQHIYSNVQMDLNCNTCVLHYLNTLLAWYEREYPLYLKSIETVTPAPQVNEIVTTNGTVTNKKGRRKNK